MNMPADPRALYDLTAANWSRHQPCSLSDYTARPQVMALCEPLAGKIVLDLGCGEGYCSRMLRQRGAQVVGLDVSERMIELARQAELAQPLGIRYDTADAVTADLGDASVDLVVAVFLFNYLGVEQMHTRSAASSWRRNPRPTRWLGCEPGSGPASGSSAGWAASTACKNSSTVRTGSSPATPTRSFSSRSWPVSAVATGLERLPPMKCSCPWPHRNVSIPRP